MYTPLVVKKPLDEKILNSSEYFSRKRPVLKPAKKLAEVFELASANLCLTRDNSTRDATGSEAKSAVRSHHKKHLMLPFWSIKNQVKSAAVSKLLEYCDLLSASARNKKVSYGAFEEVFCINSSASNLKKGKVGAKQDKKPKVCAERCYSLMDLVELEILQKPKGFSMYKIARANSTSLNLRLNMQELAQKPSSMECVQPIASRIEAELSRVDSLLANRYSTHPRKQLLPVETYSSMQTRQKDNPSLLVRSLLLERSLSQVSVRHTGWFECYTELFFATRISQNICSLHSLRSYPAESWKSALKFDNQVRDDEDHDLPNICIKRGLKLNILTINPSGHSGIRCSEPPQKKAFTSEFDICKQFLGEIDGYQFGESSVPPQGNASLINSLILPMIKSFKVESGMPRTLELRNIQAQPTTEFSTEIRKREFFASHNAIPPPKPLGCSSTQIFEPEQPSQAGKISQVRPTQERSKSHLREMNPGLGGFLRQLHNRQNNSGTQHRFVGSVSQRQHKLSQEPSQAKSDDWEGLKNLASGFKVAQYLSHQKPIKPVEAKLSKNITRELKPLGLKNLGGRLLGLREQDTTVQIRQNPYSRMLFCNTELILGLERSFSSLISNHHVMMQPSQKLQHLGLQLVVGGANLFVLPTTNTALAEQLINWIPKARYLTGFNSHQILAVLPDSEKEISLSETHEILTAAVDSVQAIVVNTCRALPTFTNLSVHYLRDSSELADTIREIIIQEEAAGRAGHFGLREFESTTNWGFADSD